MAFDEKVDVIDLIINVLKDHEQTLDELVDRLEEVISRKPSAPKLEREPEARGAMVSALLRNWSEFRERCKGSSLVAFDIDEKLFEVSAAKGNILFFYREQMPEMEIRFREQDERTIIESVDLGSVGMFPSVLRGRLECGLEVSVKGTEIELPDGGSLFKAMYDIDPEKTKEWISVQLNVEKPSILQGKIQI